MKACINFFQLNSFITCNIIFLIYSALLKLFFQAVASKIANTFHISQLTSRQTDFYPYILSNDNKCYVVDPGANVEKTPSKVVVVVVVIVVIVVVVVFVVVIVVAVFVVIVVVVVVLILFY